MSKSNGIKSLKQAAKLLNKHAPEGESLAYINPTEARILKAHGGSGIMTLSGVPSYDWWNPFSWDWTGEGGVIDKVTDIWQDKPVLDQAGKVILDSKGRQVIDKGRSIVGDALSVWAALKAKKDKEGLNAAEMEQFNKLNQMHDFAETQFATNVGQGPIVENVPTTVADVASFTDVTLPTMKTTAAQGGRIGYDNGGIGQLMPRRGRVMYPGGYAGEKFDLANLDSLEGLRDPFVPGRLDREGEGFYQDDLTGVRDVFKTSPEMIEIQKDYDIESMRDPFKPSEIQKLVQEIMKVYENIEVKDAIKLAEDLIKQNQLPGNAQGGRIGAQKGGIMPLLDMGGMEKDYRQDGGFVPIGRREKADDVPARLSKNEFVFTADAVRAAGGGDIDQGAQRMYNVMKNLEAGGEISKQSQGQG